MARQLIYLLESLFLFTYTQIFLVISLGVRALVPNMSETESSFTLAKLMVYPPKGFFTAISHQLHRGSCLDAERRKTPLTLNTLFLKSFSPSTREKHVFQRQNCPKMAKTPAKLTCRASCSRRHLTKTGCFCDASQSASFMTAEKQSFRGGTREEP